MAGFDNDTMYASNVDFSGGSPVTGKVTANGQLLVGSTASPNIKVGRITSPDGSIIVGYDSPNLTLTSASSGGITGPGSSTNRAISTWNGTTGLALFNNASATIDSNGYMTNTAQPGCWVTLITNVSNVTGDGTAYDVIFDNVIYDTTSSYNLTNGTYTCPKAGKYIITNTFLMSGIGVAHTQALDTLYLQGVLAQYSVNPVAGAVGGLVSISITQICNAALNDVFISRLTVLNGTKTVGLFGQSGQSLFTNMSIQLLS